MDYKRRRLSKKEREQIHESLGGHCAYCGFDLTIKDMQVDHLSADRQANTHSARAVAIR